MWIAPTYLWRERSSLIASEHRLLRAEAEFGLGGEARLFGTSSIPRSCGRSAPREHVLPLAAAREISVPGGTGPGRPARDGRREYAIQPAGDQRGQADIIPDLDGMKCLDLLTRDEARQHGWEALLRKTAQIWDGTWRQRNGEWELDEESADRADHEMCSYVREEQGAHPDLRLRADDLRHTLVLMVYWGSQSVRCNGPTSAQYWERAVLLTVRLLTTCSRKPNLSDFSLSSLMS